MAEQTGTTRRLSSRILVWAPAVIGLLLSGLLFLFLRGVDRERAEHAFKPVAASVGNALRLAYAQHLDELGALQRFIRRTPLITKEDLVGFVGSSDVRHPDILAMAWVPRVADRFRASHEERLVNEAGVAVGFREFDLDERPRRADQRDEYFPLAYLSNLEVDDLLGLDLGADPQYRTVLERARDENLTVASEPFLLPGHRGAGSLVLIAKPVYLMEVERRQVAERRQYLRGFVALLLRVATSIETAVNEQPGAAVDVQLVDRSAGRAAQPIYISPRGTELVRAPVMPCAEQRLEVADRIWGLCVEPRAGFLDLNQTGEPLLALALGVTLTLALTLVLSVMRGRALAIEAAVAARTAELRESEEQYRSVFNGTLDGLIALDPEDRISSFNPAAEAMFGQGAEFVQGRSISLLLGDGHQNFIEDLRCQAEGQGHPVSFMGEIEGRHRDGGTFPLEITVGERILAGRSTLFLLLRDITERKQWERELIAARDAAEAAAKAKSEFLATMSHEIRTPMNGVLGMAELLEDTYLDEEQAEFVDTILKSGRALRTLLNDVLDFSKIEAGGLVLEPISFNLELIIQEIFQLLASQARDKGLGLFLDYAADCPRRFSGDAGRIRQILVNLVGNGVKFTEQGGVTVRVSCCRQAEGPVPLVLEVQDTGIGISLEAQRRLFQPFTQADGSTTRRYGGTGLGLAISKQLLTLMDGSIVVSSLPGEGSLFHLEFDLPEAGDVQEVENQDLAGVRALIVDDNAVNRRVFLAQLSGFGARAEALADGFAALARLREAAAAGDPFELVLLDHQMPVLDGEQLGRQILADVRLGDARLVLITSFGQRGDAQRFRDLGFSSYLIKPVRGPLLRATLEAVRAQPSPPLAAGVGTSLPVQPKPEQEFSPHLQGRVLLVEDVLANRKLAKIMLQRLGLTVDMAEDGQQAVDAWSQESYDLVLMDCQMPVLDGLEATAEIRRLEQVEDKARTPVVALTANAFPEDRLRCQAAGMDDFLSKPFDLSGLRALLARWLPSTPPPSEDESAATASLPPPADEESPILDQRRMREMRATMGDDFRELMVEVMEIVDRTLAEARLALEQQDRGQLQLLAQRVKSVSADMGAVGLRESAASLETRLRQDSAADLGAGFRELELVYRRTQEALASAACLSSQASLDPASGTGS